jgi:predicted regulator of Ras-like GTPase activity (Roadblock/LC7/MglB family)
MVQEYRSEKLEHALRNLHVAVRGVKASVIVNVDGLLVASFPPSADDEAENPTNSPQVAAMAATLTGLAERTLDRLAQGKLDRILMEGEDGVMMVYPAGKIAYIAVLLEKDTRLDHAFFAANKAAVEVVEVLEVQP